MAITLFASDGTGGNKTSESQTTITLSASALAVDDVVVLLLGADNSTTGGAHPFQTGVMWNAGVSSGAITWETQRIQNRSPGAAINDGCALFVVTGKVTSAVSANSTLLFQFQNVTLAKAWRVLIVRGASPTINNFASGGNQTTTPVFTSTGSVANASLVIGAVAVESATAMTAGDADTASGSWAAFVNASSAGSGGDGTKISLGYQTKLVTATASQTFNPTVTNTDSAGAIFALGPGAPAATVTAVLTGGGVTTSTRSSARSRPSTVATGGGVVARTAAKAASSVAVTTGGGVVTHVYNRLEAHFGSASLSGAGAVVPAGVKAASQAGIVTGGGAAVVAFGGAHALAQVLTGAGVVTRTASKGAFYDRIFPIVAVDAIANKFSIGGNQTLRFPAFGFFTVTGSTGNDGSYVAGTVSYTGGQTHITIFGGDFSSAVADGQLNVVANVAVGSGRVLSTRRKDASGVAVVAGGGVVAATATASSGAEEHEGTALLTGGGVVAAVASRQAVTTQVLVGAGAVVSVAGSARGVVVARTGGGVVSYVASSGTTAVLARSYAILV